MQFGHGSSTFEIVKGYRRMASASQERENANHETTNAVCKRDACALSLAAKKKGSAFRAMLAK
jgi:hypothetical protein